MIDLVKSREEIDKIDKEIVDLFQKRMLIANDVAEYKLQTGKKILDKEREKNKLETLSKLGSNEFNQHGIRELFSQIMAISRKWQYGLLSKRDTSITMNEITENKVRKGQGVICFGDKGSYTEQAMENYFGIVDKVLYGKSFREIMEKIKHGEAEYGVLPIENTSTGGIADIYDLLVEYNNYLVGETVVKIDHALLGLFGANIHKIEKVYSHPQGIMQCTKFLNNNKHIEPINSISTADSAKKVLMENNITHSAIASERAAKEYGLEILQRNINHEDNNSTRFIIISKEANYLKEGDKVSVCFELPHKSGSLYTMLSHFIYNNLNMTKIESRPIEGRIFEYRFFVDFEGNLKDSGVKNALYAMKEEAAAFRILGNY